MEVAKNEDYTLKRMLPSQWEDYKTIRLEALKTNPEMFGSSYVNEIKYSKDDWISLLKKESRAIFGLYYIDALVGLCGIALKKDEQLTAILFSSFIKVPHRGKGLSNLFYQTRINWAHQQNCSSIIVSHRDGNDLSKAANQRFGFKYTHTEEIIWPDGEFAKEIMYSLKL